MKPSCSQNGLSGGENSVSVVVLVSMLSTLAAGDASASMSMEGRGAILNYRWGEVNT